MPDPHELRQERLVARTDRTADAAESAVRTVWLDLLRAIEAGGPWPVVHHAALRALRGLPAAAHIVSQDLAAVARDSARWAAEDLAQSLPRTHLERVRARLGGHRPPEPDRYGRPHLPHHLLEDTSASQIPTVTEQGLTVGALLPALPDHEVLRVLRAAGWAERLKALTALADPDALAARVASAVQRGLTVQQVAREIRPVVQQVQTAARRTARTAGLWVAHEAELATYDQLGDVIEGYQVCAVLDHATRPEHRKRDGERFYRVPKAGQRGFDKMPRPPRESDGSWSWNCRCFLRPLIPGVD